MSLIKTAHIGSVPLEPDLADRVIIRLSAVAGITASRAVVLCEFPERSEYVVWTAYLSTDGSHWSLENGKYISKFHLQDEFVNGWGRACEIFEYRRQCLLGDESQTVVTIPTD